LWFRAVSEGIAAPSIIRRKRDPLPRSAWKRIQHIRKGQTLELNEMPPSALQLELLIPAETTLDAIGS